MFPGFLCEKEHWAATKEIFILARPRAVKHVYNVLGPGSGSGSASPSGSFSGSFSAACSCVQVRVEANLKLGVTKPPLGSLMLSFSACCTIPSFCVSVNRVFASVLSTQSRRFLAKVTAFLFGKEAI